MVIGTLAILQNSIRIKQLLGNYVSLSVLVYLVIYFNIIAGLERVRGAAGFLLRNDGAGNSVTPCRQTFSTLSHFIELS